MKKILIILVLLFSSSVFADDISDFEIEGISIGDSLLEYFSEKEIKSKKTFHKEQGNNKEVAGIVIYDTKNYLQINAEFKTNDKNYKILALTGFVDIDRNINKCSKKKDEIVDQLQHLFNNLVRKDTGWVEHAFDTSSKTEGTIFYFPTKTEYYSFIRVQCYDWSKKSGHSDQLRIEIVTDNYHKWLTELLK